jgi:hypothetical protein
MLERLWTVFTTVFLVTLLLASCAPATRPLSVMPSTAPETTTPAPTLTPSLPEVTPEPIATPELIATPLEIDVPTPLIRVTIKPVLLPSSGDVEVAELPFLESALPISVTPNVSVEVKRKLRPEGSPDVVVMGFAGHCGPFCNVQDTWSYLDAAETDTGYIETAQAVTDILERQNYSVAYFDVSSFVKSHESLLSKQTENGYLEAQAYLNEVKTNWIADFENPTHVILLAHSHGTLWATLLAINNLDVTFDYFIYLDGICWQFWGKHKNYIRSAYRALGQPLPFPLGEGDPCVFFDIAGQDKLQDINDVVPANVIYGLEVSSPLDYFALNVVRDDDPNVRINGSKRFVWTIESQQGHSDINNRYGDAMNWIEEMMLTLGLPSHEGFTMEQFIAPPAPEGFDYSE